MRQVANKFIRDNLDNRITNQFRKAFPHFEFEYRFRRLPIYPKIVLYTNVGSAERYIEQ